MIACVRPPTPALLAKYADEVTKRYVEARMKSSVRFQWPKREGTALYDVVRDACAGMTRGHCSYCDGHPIRATGREEIDHFRPKGDERFYGLVCDWTNLFLSCSACNAAKQDQWDELLLKPDDLDFAFERYFEIRFATGELAPNGAAPTIDQQRANVTIRILDLNRADTCTARLRIMRYLRREPDDPDVPYRYMIPFFGEIRSE